MLVLRFPSDGQAAWHDAVTYFRDHEQFWKDVRNDVGGHFGSKAAEFALESFLPEAGGSIEAHVDHSGRSGVVLGFASEIAATAILKHLRGDSAKSKVSALFEEIVTAFPHAVKAVECIVAYHLWQRAG
jgi:hypothetical protein